MIAIRDIDHIVLRVADMPRMIDFYVHLLGCRVERRLDDLGLVQLRAGRALVDLVSVEGTLGRVGGAAAGAEANLDHVCFRVEPFDATAIRLHLENAGIRVGATGSRYGAEGEGPSICSCRSEGNTIELKERAWVPGGATAVPGRSGTRTRVPRRDMPRMMHIRGRTRVDHGRALFAFERNSRCGSPYERLRGMHGTRRAMEPAPRVPFLRPCRLLRGFEARARAAAFQHDGPPDDRLTRGGRALGMVLRRSPLLRSDARPAAPAPGPSKGLWMRLRRR